MHSLIPRDITAGNTTPGVRGSVQPAVPLRINYRPLLFVDVDGEPIDVFQQGCAHSVVLQANAPNQGLGVGADDKLSHSLSRVRRQESAALQSQDSGLNKPSTRVYAVPLERPSALFAFEEKHVDGFAQLVCTFSVDWAKTGETISMLDITGDAAHLVVGVASKYVEGHTVYLADLSRADKPRLGTPVPLGSRLPVAYMGFSSGGNLPTHWLYAVDARERSQNSALSIDDSSRIDDVIIKLVNYGNYLEKFGKVGSTAKKAMNTWKMVDFSEDLGGSRSAATFRSGKSGAKKRSNRASAKVRHLFEQVGPSLINESLIVDELEAHVLAGLEQVRVVPTPRDDGLLIALVACEDELWIIGFDANARGSNLAMSQPMRARDVPLALTDLSAKPAVSSDGQVTYIGITSEGELPVKVVVDPTRAQDAALVDQWDHLVTVVDSDTFDEGLQKSMKQLSFALPMLSGDPSLPDAMAYAIGTVRGLAIASHTGSRARFPNYLDFVYPIGKTHGVRRGNYWFVGTGFALAVRTPVDEIKTDFHIKFPEHLIAPFRDYSLGRFCHGLMPARGASLFRFTVKDFKFPSRAARPAELPWTTTRCPVRGVAHGCFLPKLSLESSAPQLLVVYSQEENRTNGIALLSESGRHGRQLRELELPVALRVAQFSPEFVCPVNDSVILILGSGISHSNGNDKGTQRFGSTLGRRVSMQPGQQRKGVAVKFTGMNTLWGELQDAPDAYPVPLGHDDEGIWVLSKVNPLRIAMPQEGTKSVSMRGGVFRRMKNHTQNPVSENASLVIGAGELGEDVLYEDSDKAYVVDVLQGRLQLYRFDPSAREGAPWALLVSKNVPGYYFEHVAATFEPVNVSNGRRVKDVPLDERPIVVVGATNSCVVEIMLEHLPNSAESRSKLPQRALRVRRQFTCGPNMDLERVSIVPRSGFRTDIHMTPLLEVAALTTQEALVIQDFSQVTYRQPMSGHRILDTAFWSGIPAVLCLDAHQQVCMISQLESSRRGRRIRGQVSVGSGDVTHGWVMASDGGVVMLLDKASLSLLAVFRVDEAPTEGDWMPLLQPPPLHLQERTPTSYVTFKESSEPDEFLMAKIRDDSITLYTLQVEAVPQMAEVWVPVLLNVVQCEEYKVDCPAPTLSSIQSVELVSDPLKEPLTADLIIRSQIARNMVHYHLLSLARKSMPYKIPDAQSACLASFQNEGQMHWGCAAVRSPGKLHWYDASDIDGKEIATNVNKIQHVAASMLFLCITDAHSAYIGTLKQVTSGGGNHMIFAPSLQIKILHKGNITSLALYNDERVFAGTSLGEVFEVGSLEPPTAVLHDSAVVDISATDNRLVVTGRAGTTVCDFSRSHLFAGSGMELEEERGRTAVRLLSRGERPTMLSLAPHLGAMTSLHIATLLNHFELCRAIALDSPVLLRDGADRNCFELALRADRMDALGGTLRGITERGYVLEAEKNVLLSGMDIRLTKTFLELAESSEEPTWALQLFGSCEVKVLHGQRMEGVVSGYMNVAGAKTWTQVPFNSLAKQKPTRKRANLTTSFVTLYLAQRSSSGFLTTMLRTRHQNVLRTDPVQATMMFMMRDRVYVHHFITVISMLLFMVGIASLVFYSSDELSAALRVIKNLVLSPYCGLYTVRLFFLLVFQLRQSTSVMGLRGGTFFVDVLLIGSAAIYQLQRFDTTKTILASLVGTEAVAYLETLENSTAGFVLFICTFKMIMLLRVWQQAALMLSQMREIVMDSVPFVVILMSFAAGLATSLTAVQVERAKTVAEALGVDAIEVDEKPAPLTWQDNYILIYGWSVGDVSFAQFLSDWFPMLLTIGSSIFLNILCINFLIARMSDTFNRTQENKLVMAFLGSAAVAYDVEIGIAFRKHIVGFFKDFFKRMFGRRLADSLEYVEGLVERGTSILWESPNGAGSIIFFVKKATSTHSLEEKRSQAKMFKTILQSELFTFQRDLNKQLGSIKETLTNIEKGGGGTAPGSAPEARSSTSTSRLQTGQQMGLNETVTASLLLQRLRKPKSSANQTRSRGLQRPDEAVSMSSPLGGPNALFARPKKPNGPLMDAMKEEGHGNPLLMQRPPAKKAGGNPLLQRPRDGSSESNDTEKPAFSITVSPDAGNAPSRASVTTTNESTKLAAADALRVRPRDSQTSVMQSPKLLNGTSNGDGSKKSKNPKKKKVPKENGAKETPKEKDRENGKDKASTEDAAKSVKRKEGRKTTLANGQRKDS